MLFIRYLMTAKSQGQDPLVCWALDSNSWQLSSPMTLAQLAAVVPEEARADVIVILPAEQATLYRLTLSHVQKKHLSKAVPFVLEDKLADDIDQLHFAIEAGERGQAVEVSVVHKSILTTCLQDLASYGIHPKIITTELCLLPDSNQIISIFSEGDTGWLCFAAPAEIPVIKTQKEQIPALLQQWAPDKVDTLLSSLQVLNFQMLCEHALTCLQQGKLLNLLQGDFKQKYTSHMPALNGWRSLAILIIVAVTMKLGLSVGEWAYYGHKASALKVDNIALYQHYFPHAKLKSDLKRIVKAKLRTLEQGQSSFLLLLSRVGQPLTAFEQDATTHLMVEHLNYNQQAGELVLDVRANGFPALDRVRNQLASQHLSVTVEAATQDKDSVKARMQIKDMP